MLIITHILYFANRELADVVTKAKYTLAFIQREFQQETNIKSIFNTQYTTALVMPTGATIVARIR